MEEEIDWDWESAISVEPSGNDVTSVSGWKEDDSKIWELDDTDTGVATIPVNTDGAGEGVILLLAGNQHVHILN